mmetsp:Transcript_6505/g.12325  ORF Transcript_6505/g.12325 Transcript_6505/m.12325 type:complete len:96 (+) Transcript_6505:1083-1370(+)
MLQQSQLETARRSRERRSISSISAWTASNLDALDAASSDPRYAPSSSSSAKQRAARHKLTVEDVRQMKSRQVAAHRKREGVEGVPTCQCETSNAA